LENID
jgi:hypothetical protein